MLPPGKSKRITLTPTLKMTMWIRIQKRMTKTTPATNRMMAKKRKKRIEITLLLDVIKTATGCNVENSTWMGDRSSVF